MVPILAPLQLPLLGEQWRVSLPLMGTLTPQGLLPASPQPGMLEKWSSFSCIPSSQAPAAWGQPSRHPVCSPAI